MTTENQADPYRTPVEIPGAAKPWMRSPLAWMLVAGVFSAVIILFAFVRTKTDRNVIEYVEGFGDERRPYEPELDQSPPVYDAMFSESVSSKPTSQSVPRP